MTEKAGMLMISNRLNKLMVSEAEVIQSKNTKFKFGYDALASTD